jgi:hypothetical protein
MILRFLGGFFASLIRGAAPAAQPSGEAIKI